MEPRVKIEEHVLELLGLHHCVTLPGLGSFIYRESQAASNTFTFELRPSLRTVFFNSAIVADDGLVANHLRETLGLSFAAAQHQLAEIVSEIKSRLEGNRNLPFGKLGNFFLNGENQVFFFPSPSLNLSHDTFGLPIIKLEELEKNKTTEAPRTNIRPEEKPLIKITEEDEDYEDAEVVHVEETSLGRKRNWIWKAAAALAIIMLAGTGVYFGRQFIKSAPGKTSQATLDTPAVQNNSAEQSAAAQTGPAPVAAVEPPAATNTPEETQTKDEVVSQPPAEAAQQPAVVEDEVVAKLETDWLESIKSTKGKYLVVGGKYLDQNLAELECSTWNNKHIRAVVYKAGNSSLYKVILQRFASETEAGNFTASLPANGRFKASVKEIKNFP